MELHLYDTLDTPQVTLHAPDLTKYNRAGGSSPGTLWGAPEALRGYKVEFLDPWPTTQSGRIALNHAPTHWRVTDLDDTVWLMTSRPVPGVTNYDVALPTTTTFRDGYTWNFAYNGDGTLQSVTDSLGRTITFTWLVSQDVTPAIPATISEITLPDQSKIRYSYDKGGVQAYVDRLIKVEKVGLNGDVTETTTYLYENSNFPYHVTGIIDGRGVRALTVAYDQYGRATSSELAGGADKVTVTYNDTLPSGYTSPPFSRTVTNALGKVSHYKYVATLYYGPAIQGSAFMGVDGDASANCPASSTILTRGTSYNYVLFAQDAEGRITHYVMDLNDKNRPLSITRGYGTAQASTTSYTYDTVLNVVTKMVEPGLTTNYTWTGGKLTALSQVDTTTGAIPYSSNGQTRTWSYGYNGSLLTSVDGPLPGSGDTVSYTYDANGYVASVTNEAGLVTTVNSTNGRGQPIQVTDANGVITNLTYDDLGRLLTTTVNPGPSQATTIFTYDAVGDITQITNPDGSSFSYTYDDARRLTTVTGLDGQTITYTYDLMGNRTGETIKNAGGTLAYSEAQTFDELGRLLKNIGANAQTTTYGYEKNDNLKSVTDPRSQTYSNAYDSLNRLIQTTDPESAHVNLTRDGRDNVTAYADPRNLSTTYIRNGFGEVKRRTSPDRGTTDYVRDERGLVTQLTDGRGVVTNFTYDTAGRILTKSFLAIPSENVSYTYDEIAGSNMGKGRLTSMTHDGGTIGRTYDGRGNVMRDSRTITGAGVAGLTVDYTYDVADHVTQMTYPSGRQVLFARDTMGRIAGVQTRKSSADAWSDVATNVLYEPLSRIVASYSAGNGLSNTNTYTLDYELNVLGVYDGATALIEKTFARTDNLNITGIGDNVDATNAMGFTVSAANRLQDATGPWGTKSYTYDGVGNRTSETSTPPGGSPVTDSYGYPATSNILQSITRSGTTTRSFAADGAGNVLTDTRSGIPYVYTYNNAGQLKTVSLQSNLVGTYTYNGFEQLITRVITNSGAANGTINYVHDLSGNVIAEVDTSGQTVREYIWLPETEIAPTRASRSQVDRPIAVIDAVNTASPATYYVHVDHLNRPIKMTDASKASVWDVEWTPWGTPSSITGSVSLDTRFPGQWYQLESGLNYNWHRHYDPTIGRYTQPDPLGFIDGPSNFAYATNSPLAFIDPEGRQTSAIAGVGGPAGVIIGTGIAIYQYCQLYPQYCKKIAQACYRAFSGGGGGNNDGQGKRERDYCQEQLDEDNDCCRSLNVRRHTAICGAQAMQRYGNCLVNRPIPLLGYCRR